MPFGSLSFTNDLLCFVSSPWSSIYKTYSMLLGEVDDNDFEGNKMATFFFCMYMFVVVIVLANVLIAIVTDAYGV